MHKFNLFRKKTEDKKKSPSSSPSSAPVYENASIPAGPPPAALQYPVSSAKTTPLLSQPTVNAYSAASSVIESTSTTDPQLKSSYHTFSPSITKPMPPAPTQVAPTTSSSSKKNADLTEEITFLLDDRVEVGVRFPRGSTRTTDYVVVFLRFADEVGRDIFDRAKKLIQQNAEQKNEPVSEEVVERNETNFTKLLRNTSAQIGRTVDKMGQQVNRSANAAYDVATNAQRRETTRYRIVWRSVWTAKGRLVVGIHTPLDKATDPVLYEFGIGKEASYIRLVDPTIRTEDRLANAIGLLIDELVGIPMAGTISRIIAQFILSRLRVASTAAVTSLQVRLQAIANGTGSPSTNAKLPPSLPINSPNIAAQPKQSV